MGLIADFKKGRDAAYKKRGFVPGQKDEPADDSADEKVAGEAAHAADVDIAELAETRRKLLEELSAEIENLRKRVGELETERDEAKKLLADVVAEAEGHKESLAAVEAERNEAKKLLAEVHRFGRDADRRGRERARPARRRAASDRCAQGAAKGAAPRHASQSRRRSAPRIHQGHQLTQRGL